MQIDMHYYGTYAMARAAGISAEAAATIATCAQFVDDNVSNEPITLKDGARILRRATAHHLEDIVENTDENDQREVWVPFHFLPGDEIDPGENEDHTLRLRCRKDSEPAQQMVAAFLERAAGDVNCAERAGIIAHVYADTFSHHGFSGVSSRRNRVDNEAFEFKHDDELVRQLNTWGKDFFARFGVQGGRLPNIKQWVNMGGIGERLLPWIRKLGLGRLYATVTSWIGETGSGALGHGPVATYPDQPYLKWRFVYEYPRRVAVDRDNPADFLDACRALHRMFAQLAQCRSDLADGPARPFAEIEEAVKEILASTADKVERGDAWQTAAAAGRLFAAPEGIPPYDGLSWTRWLAVIDGKIDSMEALAHPACRFHIAANAHRSWVLHELLPARNLLVA